MGDARLEAVEVTVRKLRPPLALDVASTGVRVTSRSRGRLTAAGAARAPVRAFMGLGSNLGDRRAALRRAVAHWRPRATSSRCRPCTRPSRSAVPPTRAPTSTWWWSCPPPTPPPVLERCHALEEAAGRVRTARWGPRTLDADVLLVGDPWWTSPT